MKRRLSFDLATWAAPRPDRKPLVLRGARQVGKSYLVREFGAQRFGETLELNFEREPALAACFVDNDVGATIRRVEAVTARRLRTDGSSLLFLDEIQAAPQVLARLRWFAEDLPKLPVIAAGSLLDFTLAAPAHAVPVGRIGYMHLEPMGFLEFLAALGEDPLADLIERDVATGRVADGEISSPPVHGRLLDLFRQYLLVGGMPAAVERYRTERSHLSASEVQQNLLATLRDDFGKYAGRVPHSRLTAVLDAVPPQLGSKFRFSRAAADERASALSQAVDLLVRARVCHRVRVSSAEGVPLAAGADQRAYKLIHLDVGLAARALGVSLRDLERAADVTLANEGAMAEQAVGQLLRLTFPAHEEPALYYWFRDERKAQAEVDYVLAHGTTVVPIEVKAGTGGRLKSLHELMARRAWRTAVRFNAAPASVTPISVKTSVGAAARYTLISLPIYLVEEIHRVLGTLPTAAPARARPRRARTRSSRQKTTSARRPHLVGG